MLIMSTHTPEHATLDAMALIVVTIRIYSVYVVPVDKQRSTRRNL